MFKEVNYKYLYNSTLRVILLRKYYKNLSKLFSIKLYFWYRRIQFEEVALLKLYNNLIFFNLLFKKTFILEKMNSTLKRGIYYYRLIFYFKMFENNELFSYLDIYLNGLVPLLRNDTIFSYKVNNDFLFRFKDLSLFSNLRIGDYYYMEHVTDNVYIQYSFKHINLKNYLNIFKIT
jgi:hypothetical protein